MELVDTSVDPRDPDAPVASAPPAVEAVEAILQGVLDPELGASIVDLGMLDGASVEPNGDVQVRIALTTLGCPLRAQIQRDVESKVRGLPGVREVSVDYVEMTQEQRSAVMARARREAQARAPQTEIPATTRVLAIASGKGGVGKSSVTVNLAVALAQRGLTVGVLDADIWGFSIPRMLGLSGRLSGADGKIHPNERTIPAMTGPQDPTTNASTGKGPEGRIKVISMGFLVEDEGTALMWRGLILARAFEQFLTDVRWGDMDYLLIDMPPGTGDIQMAVSRLLPQAEMLVITTPARAAQKVAVRVADMAQRSFMKVAGVVENMSEFVAPDGQRFEVFGSGGGESLSRRVGAPLAARIPIEPSVAAGGDTGDPVALTAPDSPAGAAFHELARTVVEDLVPPVEMAGCTARIFELAGSPRSA